MRLAFHPATVRDVNEAVAYYDEQRAGLGIELRRELDLAFAQIAEDPLRFPIVQTDIRRCMVQRFPYSILFRVCNDRSIRVLVIRHHRRNPTFGMTRR